MDWIRRNWPDMLIGVALIAVIAGIIVTLLGGGSPFDLVGGQRSSTPPQVQRPPVSAPATDEVESPLSALRADEAEALGEEVIPVVPLLEGEQVPAADPPATATTPAGTDQPAAQQPTTQQPAPPATQELVVQPIPPAATQQPTTPPQPAATTQATPPAAAADPASASWRIAVGSFRQRDNAERTAQQYRDEGYPVFIAQQDDLNIVLLGPYADEAAAQTLAEQLRSSGRDARLYVYRPTTAAAATPPATTTTTPPATTTATTTPQAQAPAAQQPAATQTQAPTTTQSPGAANRYVQVGAFRTTESAQPLRQRVESLGFQVTANTRDDGMIRLWVGPFTPTEAQSVSQRLNTQGIENFVLPAN